MIINIYIYNFLLVFKYKYFMDWIKNKLKNKDNYLLANHTKLESKNIEN